MLFFFIEKKSSYLRNDVPYFNYRRKPNKPPLSERYFDKRSNRSLLGIAILY